MVNLNKKQTVERCREILYGNKEVVNEDFDFLVNLLHKHPDADKKIGVGVKRIWSDRNPVYTHTRNFFLERVDGTTTDFSFMECISPNNRFKSACRNAIRPQIKAFRVAHNMTADRHVDHHPESFDSLLSRFVERNGKSKVKENEDMEYGCELVEKEYKKKWYDFHQQEARLRDITAAENLTKKRT